MPLNYPYHNIYRPGPPHAIEAYYDLRKKSEGVNNITAYKILKSELKQIFEYIEPDENNYNTYSHKTFGLLIRTCIEVESLCKLVFSKNGVQFTREYRDNIISYSDLEGAMKLSGYKVKCYGFHHPVIQPFNSFSAPTRDQRSPNWYRSYNQVKHNRLSEFQSASLENVIYALSGVYVLLIAQYGPHLDGQLKYENAKKILIPDDMFGLEQEPNWSENEKYEFNWEELKNTSTPYQNYPLQPIP